jgi:HSP20 family protein
MSMRLHYRAVLYQIEDSETTRQHYQQLVDEFMRQVQSSRPLARRDAAWRPPADIHETNDAYVIKLELAGMAEEDIEVTLYDDAVTISGTRVNDEIDEEVVSFHEAQIRYGPFQATFLLHTPIDRDGADARYHNGFLRLRLPKQPPGRLQVKSGHILDVRHTGTTGLPERNTNE